MPRPTTLTLFVLAVLTTLVANAESKDDGRARVFVPESLPTGRRPRSLSVERHSAGERPTASYSGREKK